MTEERIELNEEAAAPTADRMSQIAFDVPGYPPAKSEALSMLGSSHPHMRRVRALLEAARQACRQQAFVPIESGHVALDVVLRVQPGEAQSDATNYLGGIGDVLEDKSHHGMLNHLGDLAAVWLYRNDRQIKEVSYRETEASQPAYTVTVRKLGNP